MVEEVVMPYRKKKGSSTSKAKKKSNHKHVWEHCLLHTILPEKHFGWVQEPTRKAEILEQLSPGLQCSVCGQVRQDYNVELRFTHTGRFLRAVGKDELKNLHPEWPIIEVPGEDWYKI